MAKTFLRAFHFDLSITQQRTLANQLPVVKRNLNRPATIYSVASKNGPFWIARIFNQRRITRGHRAVTFGLARKTIYESCLNRRLMGESDLNDEVVRRS
jgi:hypothetical protein